MTIMEMLGQSSVLAVLGMSVVFLFLIVMIICMIISGKIIQKMGLDKDIKKSGAAASPGAGAAKQITAAIVAAVSEYRKNEND